MQNVTSLSTATLLFTNVRNVGFGPLHSYPTLVGKLVKLPLGKNAKHLFHVEVR